MHYDKNLIATLKYMAETNKLFSELLVFYLQLNVLSNAHIISILDKLDGWDENGNFSMPNITHLLNEAGVPLEQISSTFSPDEISRSERLQIMLDDVNVYYNIFGEPQTSGEH